mmetsp:Transcript_120789/g.352821  ORF Transcript_120789/g.352821 Transcript_120789/m.352821 type:complete len:287 (-) Transcript_120789:106-966(-)
MWRFISVAIVLPSSVVVPSAGAGSPGGLDQTSLLQVQAEQGPSPETYTWGMKSWLEGYYNIIRGKGDKWLIKCCDMARETGIDPWNSWGTATEEQQKTWTDSNCNAIVGSGDDEIGIGIPNCDNGGSFDSLLHKKPMSLALHRSTEEGCDSIDRESIEDEYFDRDSIPNTMSIDCTSERLVKNAIVNYTRLTSCTKSILQISDTCTDCYVNFVKNVAGTPDTPGCFTTCSTLMSCFRRTMCSSKLKICASCIHPALREFDRCVGQGTPNKMTIDGFLKKMVKFHAP